MNTNKKIGANAYSTRDSIGLKLHVISAQYTLEICVAAWNREDSLKTRYFCISSLFKIVDVGTFGKLVTSACYDKQRVYVYLQPFSR